MTVTCNTGSQGRRAKTLSRALDADSEAAPVGRAAGERGRRSIAELGERLQRLRFVRTLLPAIERLPHPRPRARSVLFILCALGGYTLSEASDPPLRTGRTPALAAQRV